MTVPRPTTDGAVSRRQMIASTGALAIGGTAAMALGSQPVRAEVQLNDNLNIPKSTYSGKDASVTELALSVDGSYSFSTNGADGYSLDLQVASAPDTSDWQSVDSTDGSVLANSSGGTFNLSGSILSHDALEASQFSASAAETVTNDVPVRVLLTVTHGGETVVEATASTLATIEVTNESVEVSAEVTGDGSVQISV